MLQKVISCSLHGYVTGKHPDELIGVAGLRRHGTREGLARAGRQQMRDPASEAKPVETQHGELSRHADEAACSGSSDSISTLPSRSTMMLPARRSIPSFLSSDHLSLRICPRMSYAVADLADEPVSLRAY